MLLVTLLLLLFPLSLSEKITAPRIWLNLQFSSSHPVDDLRLKNLPLHLYTRDDSEGTHILAMDEVPNKWHVDVSNELDHASLSLNPTWDLQRVDFNIRERSYELAYQVTCKIGYYGEKCDRMCSPLPGNHYSCSAEGQKTCHEGWTGENCEKKIDACTANPCSNDGVCQMGGANGFSCSCPRGFEGITCEKGTAFLSPEVLRLLLRIASVLFLILIGIAIKIMSLVVRRPEGKSLLPLYSSPNPKHAREAEPAISDSLPKATTA